MKIIYRSNIVVRISSYILFLNLVWADPRQSRAGPSTVPPKTGPSLVPKAFREQAAAKWIADTGLATAWIDRRHDQTGWGATMAVADAPKTDFHFTSMADMVDRLKADLE